MAIQRSSETLRKASFFNFTEFHKANPFERRSQAFYEWFLGFAEGDGCYFSSLEKDTRQLQSRPSQRLRFMLVQKDPTVLYFIRSQFGFGQVRTHGPNAYVWSVTKKDHIKLLCLLAKDNVVLPKVRQNLKIWCDYFNLVQCVKPLSSFSLLSTGWFAGFIDAEGCFNVYKRQDRRYSKGFFLRYRFIIDQKTTPEFFAYIKQAIGSGSFYDRGNGCLRYTLNSKTVQQSVLLPYFIAFPLHTKKQVQVFQWRKDFGMLPGSSSEIYNF